MYVLLLSAGTMAYIHLRAWHPDSDISFDSPYHVTMADQFGQMALRRQFPWTQKSLWRTRFYDKELAFHAVLMSIRRWAGLFGYDGDSPPFVLETSVLLALFVLVFLVVLRREGVRHPFLFIPAVLFFSPFFLLRMNMVRPHVLSVALMLLAGTVLSSPITSRRPLMQLAGLGFALAYCHSNPHLILLPAVCYTLVRWRDEGAKACLPPIAATVGVMLGLTLHPQFPNTFVVWKVQCVDVVLQAATGGISDMASPVELTRPGLKHVVQNGFPVAALLVLAAVVLRRRTWSQTPFALRYYMVLAAFSLAGYLVSKRMMEYGMPYTVMAVAIAYEHHLGTRPLRCHMPPLAVGLLAAGLLVPVHVNVFATARAAIPRGFASWARSQLQPGTYVANLRWDDFPRLFFAAPEYVYSYGLDPMFAYAALGESYLQLERYSRGTVPFPPQAELKDILGSRYVFVSDVSHRVARRMATAGYALAYQGIDGWCFDLDAPSIDHRVEERLEPTEPQ